eukprot:jgi/Tetstr1/436303/TSEL_025143.t2
MDYVAFVSDSDEAEEDLQYGQLQLDCEGDGRDEASAAATGATAEAAGRDPPPTSGPATARNGDGGGGGGQGPVPAASPATAEVPAAGEGLQEQLAAAAATAKQVARDVEHQVRVAQGVPVELAPDARITVLFDLNGVLVKRKGSKSGGGKGRLLRAGLHHIGALAKDFRLGVYTSATLPTMHASVGHIEQVLRAPGMFEVLMCRNQCVPAPQSHIDKSGSRPWDVVKPLAPSFPGNQLRRVVLVDDDSFKALEGEERNMLLVPTCGGSVGSGAEEGEEVLSELVARLRAIAAVEDVRECTEDISRGLFALPCVAGASVPQALPYPADGAEVAMWYVCYAAVAAPAEAAGASTDVGPGDSSGSSGGDSRNKAWSSFTESGFDNDGGETEDEEDLGEFHSAGTPTNALRAPPTPEGPPLPVRVPSTVDVARVAEVPVPERGSGPGAAATAGMCRLHNEIAVFVNTTAPTRSETEAVAALLEEVGKVGRRIWGDARVALFGSQAHGLALPGSDLDIVVLGVTANMRCAATGFTKSQQHRIGSLLQQLLTELKKSLEVRHAKVIKAKVPIIKCEIRVGKAGEYAAVDISMGAANGTEAAEFIAQEIVMVPPLRPLVLVVKAFLRQKGLNEVYTGGLSSYSIFLMVLAHLQAERLVPPDGSTPDPSAQYPPLGLLLWGFFQRYGCAFNYHSQAVSVGQGGVVKKMKQWRNKKQWLLAVEDPQVVRAAFAAAAEALLRAVASHGAVGARQETAEQREARLWAQVQSDGASTTPESKQHNHAAGDRAADHAVNEELPILSSILDCGVEVRRGNGSSKGRARAEGAGRGEVAAAAGQAGFSIAAVRGGPRRGGDPGGKKGKRSVKSTIEEKMAKLQGAGAQPQGGRRGQKRHTPEATLHDFNGPEQAPGKSSRRQRMATRSSDKGAGGGPLSSRAAEDALARAEESLRSRGHMKIPKASKKKKIRKQQQQNGGGAASRKKQGKGGKADGGALKLYTGADATLMEGALNLCEWKLKHNIKTAAFERLSKLLKKHMLPKDGSELTETWYKVEQCLNVPGIKKYIVHCCPCGEHRYDHSLDGDWSYDDRCPRCNDARDTRVTSAGEMEAASADRGRGRRAATTSAIAAETPEEPARELASCAMGSSGVSAWSEAPSQSSRKVTAADCLTWGSGAQFAGYTRSRNVTAGLRTDPADLPAAGTKATWTSINDDFRRRRMERESNTVLHTHVNWCHDPAEERKKFYPPSTPPVEPHPPNNKPDFQFDISDVEGASPRSRPGVEHHRCISSPTSRAPGIKSLRCTNTLAPEYSWAIHDSLDGNSARAGSIKSGDHLRWSTGSLMTKDIEGTQTAQARTRTVLLNPLDVSNIPGATHKPRHPPTPPKTARPDVDTRKLGRYCFGDSGLFTKTERQAIVDPLAPNYHYDPKGTAWRKGLQEYTRQIKSVPRTWDSVKHCPGEIPERIEALGAVRAAKSQGSYHGRNSACLAMYTKKAERAFEASETARCLSAWA